MEEGYIAGYVSIALSIGGAIFLAVNHTRVRSRCCRKSFEVSLDVDRTSPIGRNLSDPKLDANHIQSPQTTQLSKEPPAEQQPQPDSLSLPL
jgi:hypothetical protein